MVQQLLLRDQFEAVLQNYRANQEAIDILIKTPLVLMAGLTGSGRNTIIGKLVETGRYVFVKSDTTRAPRVEHGVKEKDGGPYWFKTEQEVLDGLEQGRYFEAAIIHNQQVSALSVSEIEKVNANHQIAVTEVTPEGIKTYSALKPDVRCIFMLPPSFEVWLERLKKRSEMPQEELTRRQRSALKEVNDLLGNGIYRAVVNDDLAHATSQVIGIVEQAAYSDAEHSRGLRVAEQIKKAIEQELVNQ